MKNLILFAIFLSVLSPVIQGQPAEKKVETEIESVTVFVEGAQISRTEDVYLNSGETIVKFINLSPFIQPPSVQAKSAGNITVLSANHHQNYLDEKQKPEEIEKLEKQLETIDDEIEMENTMVSILNEQLTFLRENRNISGKNEATSLENLRQTADYYQEQITDLKMKMIERTKVIEDLREERQRIANQINTQQSIKRYPTGEVWVKVETNRAGTYPFEVSYVVDQASWFPAYDIRVEEIDQPARIVYKANVQQNTQTDWKDIDLSFSSANPDVSGTAPRLKTWFLNYNTMPPVYGGKPSMVRGRVTDPNGEPLPGANVVVEGTTIGTVTDMNGNYSISLPEHGNALTFSFIGYQSQTIPVTGSLVNARLLEDDVALDEVVVRGYGSDRRMRRANMSTEEMIPLTFMEEPSQPIPVQVSQSQTYRLFEIDKPYTIASGAESMTVEMVNYELPATYVYRAVPKLNPKAFLIAGITEWEQLNLMDGEASIFFENTFVGKTVLDTRRAADTLELSLGADDMVSINREKIRDYTTRQFIGNKKEETIGFKTTIKNNKNQPITIEVVDQIPVSTLEEIEVELEERSGGKLDEESGFITWEIKLEPNEEKEIELRYSVRYPKNRQLILD